MITSQLKEELTLSHHGVDVFSVKAEAVHYQSIDVRFILRTDGDDNQVRRLLKEYTHI